MPVDRNAVHVAQNRLLWDAFAEDDRAREAAGEREEGAPPTLSSDPPDWRRSVESDAGGIPPRAMFRTGRLLVRDRDHADAVDVLARLTDGDRARFPRLRPNLVAGITQIQLPPGLDTLAALREVEAELGVGAADVDLLLSIAPAGRCPATEPLFVTEDARPWPPPASGGPDGSGVRVGVVDTGLLKRATHQHPWLADVKGDVEPETTNGTDIPLYTGHGTFIAGVVKGVAPRAEVFVARNFLVAGGEFDTDVAMRVVEMLEAGVDVISLSAGTYTYTTGGMLALRTVIEEVMPRYKGAVLVAAAGNDAVSTPFLPAGMSGVVSVGAISRADDDRASFSNYGGWVDVYAPGEDFVNAYANGTYTYKWPPEAGQTQEFAGMARWSGTSFATPLVAGLIAARMSVTGENGRTAAERLLDIARSQAIPGVGAVLRPGDADLRRGCGHHGHHGHHEGGHHGGCGC